MRVRGQAALFLWSAVAGRWSPLRVAAALSTGAGVAVYAVRWPERRWPGRWDLLGHSHGTFHVLTSLAAVCCVTGVRQQLQEARPGQVTPVLLWWVEVGYAWVAAALVVTALGFTGVYAAAERRGKRTAAGEGMAAKMGRDPLGGDPEVRAGEQQLPANGT